ncbi:MAG: NAD-binding protein [Phenylobacterium sp.]|uniref:NAD(P)-dependent oxidoreductase n=1 Tax=Phenylobacterium sp. TaxID=1871053 RepID=UPI001B6D7D2C|nr:NAD(P)-dependent oxidoreductase [Phenylobacterium sp.]MBP7651322.1 NAD-binding protein [Phenylobacterium sp.]MBP7816973.1 NAD-binding protein [Phenylobacterium sp.]
MQLLLSAAAHQRIKDRIAPFVGDLDIVTVTDPDSFQRNGQDISGDEVDPEIVWTTLDAYGAGLLPTLMGRILKGSKTQWMQTFNAGLDAPIFKSVMAKGVRLSKSNAQAVAIAEYVLSHALALIAPIAAQAQLQASKTWKSTPYREVSQTRWTLIGAGAIGTEIARRAKAFGVHLTVVRHSDKPADMADATITMADLSGVLPESDVVVLACALNDETRDLANDAFFDALKPGAILINIGRGGLVDEDALKRGLDAGKPAYAVLDVFQVEPLPADSWMWDHPNVRISAHTSNSGQGTPLRGDQLFVDNLRRFLAGEPLINEASPSEVGL